MKGTVFTVLQEMVEDQMGMEMWDSVISESDLPSNGIYTSAASYDDEEIFSIVGKLVEKTGVAAPDLLDAFGQFLFSRLHSSLPESVSLPDTFFEYLEKVDSVIHLEVKKLDASAETPEVLVKSKTETTMVVQYYSVKKLCHLAIGLLKGAAEHFGEKITVTMPQCMHDGSPHCKLVLEKQ